LTEVVVKPGYMLEHPSIPHYESVPSGRYRENVTGADNQQERPSIEAIPASLGSFLSGFALGEGSFMLVCRKRAASRRGFRISAAFNVSQHDIVPLGLFRETLGCGGLRRAGNNGWYWEVNALRDLRERIVPFFDRFPVVGQKASDYRDWREAVLLLSGKHLSDDDYHQVLALRERMNRGGKRRHRMDGILRDYTPGQRSGASLDEIVRSHGRP
jgi:LAGLIDADG endonuclease